MNQFIALINKINAQIINNEMYMIRKFIVVVKLYHKYKNFVYNFRP